MVDDGLTPEQEKALDELFNSSTPETKLLNDVCGAATKEGARFSQFTMENVGDNWKRIEFYWKPKEPSDVELKVNI